MIKLKFFTTLIAMAALCYGILEIQSFLNINFIENDTPIKEAFNRFLNGHLD